MNLLDFFRSNRPQKSAIIADIHDKENFTVHSIMLDSLMASFGEFSYELRPVGFL